MVDAAVGSKGKCGLLHFVALIILCVVLYASYIPYGISFFARNSLPEPTTSASESSVLAPSHGGHAKEDGGALVLDNQAQSPCSSLPNDTICCDRSDQNADVCFVSGDVRTDAASLSLLLFPAQSGAATVGEERIRPYTRKLDGSIVRTIHEVRLRVSRPEKAAAHRCDVWHDAPAVVMMSGGFGGNYFHDFNDGFLPAWLTAQHLRRRAVLVPVPYDPRWASRYSEVISGLSDHPVVDLVKDKRTHCFPGAILGTRFHGYLAVDPTRLRDKKTILDFQKFLTGVYDEAPSTEAPARALQQRGRRRPRLGIVSRRGTRVIENQAAVARLAASVGFDVDILETPASTVKAMYAAVRACDALLGVHGSDLTNLLFLRPGRAALAQVVPLGVSPIARECFGAPALRMGLRYEQYDVRGRESSLSREYGLDSVVVAHPEKAVLKHGGSGGGVGEDDWDWDFIDRVYLGGQNVSIDLARFRKTLTKMHSFFP